MQKSSVILMAMWIVACVEPPEEDPVFLDMTGAGDELQQTDCSAAEGSTCQNGRVYRLLEAEHQQWSEDLPPSMYAATPVFGAVLPSSVDHRPHQTPVRDQGNALLCADFAVVAGMEAYHQFVDMPDDLSEQALHSLHAEAEIEAALNAARSTQIPEEDLWPLGQDHPNPNWEESVRCALEWKAIGNPTPDTLRAHLASSATTNVVVALNFAEAAWSASGLVETFWGDPSGYAHAVVLVGYRQMLDSTGQLSWWFIAKNSWGEDWGVNGYAYINEMYLTRALLQAAIVTEVYSTSNICDHERCPCGCIASACLPCPASSLLCEPCQVAEDCIDEDSSCVAYDGEPFCARSCTETPCPTGYQCIRESSTRSICVPQRGDICPRCTPDACPICGDGKRDLETANAATDSTWLALAAAAWATVEACCCAETIAVASTRAFVSR
ncbi:MAG: C1 family peptidase, partial [Myxococcota bacterium]|nr:C1 family peptidase [Myxococcota bacterium]